MPRAWQSCQSRPAAHATPAPAPLAAAAAGTRRRGLPAPRRGRRLRRSRRWPGCLSRRRPWPGAFSAWTHRCCTAPPRRRRRPARAWRATSSSSAPPPPAWCAASRWVGGPSRLPAVAAHLWSRLQHQVLMTPPLIGHRRAPGAAAGLAGRVKQTLFPPLPQRLLYSPRCDFSFPHIQFQADVASGSDALVASTAGRGGRGRGRGRCRCAALVALRWLVRWHGCQPSGPSQPPGPG